MLLKELLKAIQPVEVAGDSDIEITGVTIDCPKSRRPRLHTCCHSERSDCYPLRGYAGRTCCGDHLYTSQRQ